ncbi:permease of phosphate ABC transporter [Lachnospiraceae bacterium 54-53]
MKNFMDCADAYVRKCDVKDFALLKICLCAVGIMIGLSIPEKKKKLPLAAAGVVFVFSYILLMAGFIKICMEERR